MNEAIEQALAIGEIAWALRGTAAAIVAARKVGGAGSLQALRRHAELQIAYADDTDLPDLARAAKAWTHVTEHETATAADFDALAWAELLAFKPKKAKAALDAALAMSPATPRPVTVAAVAWALRRKDAKRLSALEQAAATAENDELGWVVRLLVQADRCPLGLADRFAAAREQALAIWDPQRALAVQTRVHAYRGAGERERAAEILATWVTACAAALPDPDDVRRHVLDIGEGSPTERLQRGRARVRRVERTFGTSSPALERPLALLAYEARHADEHAVAVEALQKLVLLRAKGNSAAALADRYDVLMSLYQSQIALGRFDDALSTIVDYEKVKARRALHMVPAHHARAQLYEAMGDLDRMVQEHLAAVAQYEAGAAPVYGPEASNTRLARGWARMALERAGRHAEAEQRFPRESKVR